MKTNIEKPSIFGIDILPQSSPQGTLAFSLVILRGGQILESYDHVSLSRLLRLIRSIKPRFIAMDNIYELASSQAQLLRIISLLPIETQIIQATGSPKEGMRQLHLIAAEHGLRLPSKASPLQTAETGARLASMGIGYVIETYKKRTIVAVSKGRVFGPGGMSQQRYRRRLCLAVFQVAHRIREGLKTQGIDYDLTVRRSRWGYENCRFTVYADRPNLYGIVKPMRGPDVRVKVEPVVASELEFKPLNQLIPTPTARKTRPTIVGIDPGIVTGVAMISLEGEILSLFSGRGLDRAKIIESLTNIGHPVMVCSDVSPPPETVRKVAAALDSKVFYPDTPLSTVTKREITQRYLEGVEAQVRVEDTHQRDALAGALKAYSNLIEKFAEADARIRERGLRVSRDLVKVEIIRGATIAEALEMATPLPPPVTQRLSQPEDEGQLFNVKIRSLEDRLLSQREIIEKLTETRDQLQVDLVELCTRIKELEQRLERERSASEAQLRQNREFDKLQSRIRNLEVDLQNLNIEAEVSKFKHQRLREIVLKSLKNQLAFVKNVPSMTRQSVEQANSELAIGRGDSVFISEPSTATLDGAQALTSKHVRAIIVTDELPQVVTDFIEGHGIPVLPGEGARVEEFNGLFFVDLIRLDGMILASRERIEAKEHAAGREMLGDVLEDYRRRRNRQAP